MKNIKQKIWAENKIQSSLFRKWKIMSLTVLGLFLFSFAGIAITDDNVTADDITTPSGVVIATIMGAVGNIDNPPNSQRVGKQVKSKVWIISEDQLDTDVSFPGLNGREMGTIPLKNGEYWHYIDAVYNSPRPTWAGEDGENAANITNELPLVIGGVLDETFNLLETGLGQGFYVIWEICATGEKFSLGTGCKPARMVSFEGASNDESTVTNVVFRQEGGFLPFKYVGTIPKQAPDVVAADATVIPLTSNPQYQLTDGTVAIVDITSFSGVTDSDIGRVVTILGSGGTYPSTISSGNDFILNAGAQWSALANASIDFKIYKSAGAGYSFIEVVGTRS